MSRLASLDELLAEYARESIRRAERPRPRVPVIIDFDTQWRANKFGFSISEERDTWSVRLRASLAYQLWKWREIDDDSDPGNFSPSYGGTAFEPALFGMKPVFRDDAPPWLGRPVVQGEADLARLDLPDFLNSGFMPLIHRWYDEAKEHVGDTLRIEFPRWWKSPFELAVNLRGMTDFLEDMALRPRFALQLLEFSAGAAIKWVADWEDFTGEPYGDANLGEDSADTNLISPAMYREFVLPYDRQVAMTRPGVHIHSCGNLTPVLDDIAEAYSNLNLLHISAWTDLKRAADVFAGTRTKFYKCVHPVRDILHAPPGHQERLADEIAAAAERVELRVNTEALPSHTPIERAVRLMELIRERT